MAAAMGMEFIAYPTTDLREAATKYRDIQAQMNARTDALWLPFGGPARDKTIIQNILETAWTKDQIVFSSNLGDVKRGALFAMYPDNVGMGKELGKMLKHRIENSADPSQFEFTSALFKAVNRRTAEHLQLQVGYQQLNEYDFVYPPQ